MRSGSDRNGHWAPTDARNSWLRVMVVGRDRGDLGVGDGDLRVERRELEVLLVLLGAVVAAGERQDQRVVALDLAEPARDASVWSGSS